MSIFSRFVLRGSQSAFSPKWLQPTSFCQRNQITLQQNSTRGLSTHGKNRSPHQKNVNSPCILIKNHPVSWTNVQRSLGSPAQGAVLSNVAKSKALTWSTFLFGAGASSACLLWLSRSSSFSKMTDINHNASSHTLIWRNLLSRFLSVKADEGEIKSEPSQTEQLLSTVSSSEQQTDQTPKSEPKREQIYFTDKASGTKFPANLSFDTDLALAGTSTRVLWYLFNTYSVGIYLDRSLLKLLISTLGPEHADQIPTKEESDSMRRKTLASSTDKLIRIVPLRDTDGTHMSRSFSDQLRKFLLADQAATKGKLSGYEKEVETALSLFEECWPKKKLPAGAPVDFLLSKEGSALTVIINGAPSGELILSRDLCQALISIYLGDSSSLDLKSTWGNQIMDKKQLVI